MNTFIDQNNTEVEKLKSEVIIVYTQTQIESYSETEVSPKHGYFRNPENFLNQSATYCSSSKFDDGDEFSSVQNDATHVNYAHHGYLSSYTVTNPRQ